MRPTDRTFTGRPRSGEVSSIHFQVPAEHAGAEADLEEYRASGFHDPIQLRGIRDGAHLVPREYVAEGADWDY